MHGLVVHVVALLTIVCGYFFVLLIFVVLFTVTVTLLLVSNMRRHRPRLLSSFEFSEHYELYTVSGKITATPQNMSK